MAEPPQPTSPPMGARPAPDPTERTIDSLRREIGALRELIETRLDAGDKAVELHQAAIDRIPTHVKEGIHQLKELHESRFTGFRELYDARFQGNQTALDAALKTQKEGADKIESNFTKQMDNVIANIQTMNKGFDDKINDLKDRFNTTEGRGIGRNDFIGWIVAAVVIVGGIAGMLATRT